MRDNGQTRLERLSAALATPLERAAGAVARLDSVLAGHPLAPAWAYRPRLDAVRRQAAVDGQIIDPWHLAAMIDRGAVFAGRPSCVRTLPVVRQARRGTAGGGCRSGGPSRHGRQWVVAAHRRRDRGPCLARQRGARPPLRAALAGYWPQRRLTPLPCPLLSGATALHAEVPWAREMWIGEFLDAVAQEAEDGITLLSSVERQWFAARRAVAGRRRDSRAGAAVDILAAAPLVSATSLGQALGIATTKCSGNHEHLCLREAVRTSATAHVDSKVCAVERAADRRHKETD